MSQVTELSLAFHATAERIGYTLRLIHAGRD